MNPQLQPILDFIQQNEKLTAEEKNNLIKAVKKVSSDLEISEFKLERTEKVKRTTAILLEETIEELEQKRKAVEAQNRELEIESALERVRAVAMGMNKPDDLLSICEVLFKELQKLGFNELRNSMINIHDDEKESFLNYDFSDFAGAVIANVDYNIYPSIQILVNQSRNSKDAFIEYVYSGQELKDWKEFRKQNGEYDDPRVENITSLYYYFYSIGIGSIGISAFSSIGAERLELLKRFRNVFDLAYKRYTDITKAEAQAREAIKQSSLDRVRAEIASMRTAYDLQRITPLMWRELTALGLPFFRCGVFIINEKEKKIHLYLSTPDNLPLAALHLDFHISETTDHAIEYWRVQKVYTEHWNREQFISWTQTLIGRGQIKTEETYQGGEPPPESLTLQFVPFLQGMLYVGSIEPLSEEQIGLVQSLADAFSVAYARYEDFVNLEAAKEKVDNTLKELRSTQAQLIQSEKMASLGELTAGIAHEIQNPLNFVNNFSEVSKELLDEMRVAIEKGDTDDAKEIMNDVIQNLEKINHHGKRADGIVKGMLQHSRSSSGVKEPTDINVLADEYFRLAYHGLRAKDKSFNAATKTDYDETIGLIKIIPQDIGRVILNLFTNAFYAVMEKKKLNQDRYEPVVSVSTRKSNSSVEISVKDNGNGIPQKVLDKIFQPFFTTKPTGQGTGLGLSLAYDIVKAHGGEIKVETKEGKGTEFIIQLPG